MTKIPDDKKHFYSKDHLALRESRKNLKSIYQPTNLRQLSRLEQDIAKEAFNTIANESKEIHITLDSKIYAQDLQRMSDPLYNEDIVYILCDKEGNLKDLESLLPFVSPDKRKEYQTLRDDYLKTL